MPAAAVKKTHDDPPPGPLPPPAQGYTHRRFNLPDLNDKGAWIIKRLRERYPHSQDYEMTNFLRGATGMDDFLFVRTDHAFALSQVVREPLMRNPIVKEWFVLHDDAEDEAGYLYTVIYDWARHQGAAELFLENFSDVSRDLMKERIGKLFLREVLYSKLDRA